MEEGGGGDGGIMRDGSSSHMGEDKLSSLFFQGSVADAITGAKTGQKVLVVFVSGKDEESVNLECATLQQSQVVSELQQQCLVLRLAEGSTDAGHFSAIYPLRHVPTIMFLGLNGSLLHQLEGFQTAEGLLATIQQSVAAFTNQLQKAAAASAMVALLFSANMSPASTAAGSSENQMPALATLSSQPGQSSKSIEPVSSERQLPISQDAEQATASRNINNQVEDKPMEDAMGSQDAEQATASGNISNQVEDKPMEDALGSQPAEQSTASRNISNQVEDKPMEDALATVVLSTPYLGSLSTDCPSDSISESVPLTSKPDNVDCAQIEVKAEVHRVTKKKSSSSCEPPVEKPVRIRTGPFLLQIRLENGETVQGTFESSQCLRDVKEFVDFQRTDGRSSYNLAIPFPRKVFFDRDLERTLLELELGPRSTLIVVTSISVPEDSARTRASVNQGLASTLPSGAPAPSGSLLGRLLSFLNPFAYFGGGAPADLQGIPSGPSWQHNTNPAFARAVREGFQPPVPSSSQPQPSFATPYNAPTNQSGQTTGSGSLSQRKAWGVHGNVHTLRQDDDEVSPKGNRYWNGNSTQFGGDDDSKED